MSDRPLHTRHERLFRTNRFVYPVISRRSRGLSIGINLNPDKACNFHCVYCQVDRAIQSETRFVEQSEMLDELDRMFDAVVTGRLWQANPFDRVPSELRRLNDIAFSGDGEPTTHRNFDDVVAACADVKRRHGQHDCKMVLITNASMLHRPHIQRGLEILDANNGEIWAKLEAGTDEYFQLVDRSPIRFERILDNIRDAAVGRPIVIQSLFMRVHDQSPPPAELQAYCCRLNEIVSAGGRIKLVQIYTIARQTAEAYVEPLSNAEVDEIVTLVRRETKLPAAAFYGYSES